MPDVDEQYSRLVPYDLAEIQWARERPGQHRTPIPKPGDRVLFRTHAWGDVVEAEVLEVQPLDDQSDPNLWEVPTNLASGLPLMHQGRPVAVLKPDPWPEVKLRLVSGAVHSSREARLRGAAGWLPLDWRTRYRPVPGSVLM